MHSADFAVLEICACATILACTAGMWIPAPKRAAVSGANFLLLALLHVFVSPIRMPAADLRKSLHSVDAPHSPLLVLWTARHEPIFLLEKPPPAAPIAAVP